MRPGADQLCGSVRPWIEVNEVQIVAQWPLSLIWCVCVCRLRLFHAWLDLHTKQQLRCFVSGSCSCLPKASQVKLKAPFGYHNCGQLLDGRCFLLAFPNSVRLCFCCVCVCVWLGVYVCVHNMITLPKPIRRKSCDDSAKMAQTCKPPDTTTPLPLSNPCDLKAQKRKLMWHMRSPKSRRVNKFLLKFGLRGSITFDISFKKYTARFKAHTFVVSTWSMQREREKRLAKCLTSWNPMPEGSESLWVAQISSFYIIHFLYPSRGYLNFVMKCVTSP